MPSRTVRAIAVVVALFGLLGCSDGGDAPTSSPTTGVEQPSPPTTEPPTTEPPTTEPPTTEPPTTEPGGAEEDGPQDRAAEREIEESIFEMVNAERRERGVPPLEWDEQLAQQARSWSQEMADRGRLEHQDPGELLQTLEGFEGVGENIFQSTGAIPAGRAHVGWMRSDGHRRNILDPGFDRLGIGVICDEDGQTWATQHFGRTIGADQPRPGQDIPPEEPIVAEESEGPSCPGGPPGDIRLGG